MKVPLAVIIGKSPMNTVWLLISPVAWLVNSAVTNSGAQYVRSFFLHSSIDAFTSSKRGADKDSDILLEKSSMGLISSSNSARPVPASQSNDSVWMARRLGTSSCSVILPKEVRRGAKTCPSEGRTLSGERYGASRPAKSIL